MFLVLNLSDKIVGSLFNQGCFLAVVTHSFFQTHHITQDSRGSLSFFILEYEEFLCLNLFIRLAFQVSSPKRQAFLISWHLWF